MVVVVVMVDGVKTHVAPVKGIIISSSSSSSPSLLASLPSQRLS